MKKLFSVFISLIFIGFLMAGVGCGEAEDNSQDTGTDGGADGGATDVQPDLSFDIPPSDSGQGTDVSKPDIGEHEVGASGYGFFVNDLQIATAATPCTAKKEDGTSCYHCYNGDGQIDPPLTMDALAPTVNGYFEPFFTTCAIQMGGEFIDYNGTPTAEDIFVPMYLMASVNSDWFDTAGLYDFSGQTPKPQTPAWCTEHASQTGDFLVDPRSFEDGQVLIYVDNVKIANGIMTGAGGIFQYQFPLDETVTINLELSDARISGAATFERGGIKIINGLISGVISKALLQEQIAKLTGTPYEEYKSMIELALGFFKIYKGITINGTYDSTTEYYIITAVFTAVPAKLSNNDAYACVTDDDCPGYPHISDLEANDQIWTCEEGFCHSVYTP